MCRALKLLCAAPDKQRLLELKRAAVSATWELVGGATSVEDLAGQIDEWRPDIVVVDASLGPRAIAVARATSRRVRIVTLGVLEGADAAAGSLDEVGWAILGLPQPGGPVGS